MRKPRSTAAVMAAVLVLAAGLCASASLQRAIDVKMAAYQNSHDAIWISSPKLLKALSLGQDGLLADIYWTRSVQYYGSRLRDHKTDFSLLAPLLNITVSLDPHLLLAYYFGAFFLSAKPPRGAGQPEQAIALLRRGIQANPDEWRLWHHLGFIYYWELRDYAQAAKAYEQGAKNPQAPPFMKVMAAAVLQKGGNQDTSQFLWSEIYRSAEDPTIRENALLHLHSLQAQADIQELEKRVRVYREETGEWPKSFRQLVERTLLAGVPDDPQGFPYQLQPDGAVRLDPKSTAILDADRAPSPGDLP